MDYIQQTTKDIESEIESELTELGEVSTETKGGFWGMQWDGGSSKKP